MKTILIPTDFSDNAWKAAGYAANLHRNIPCCFVIVHAYYVPGVVLEIDVSAYIASRTKEINDKMIQIQQEFEEFDHHPDTTVEIVARYGIASQIIEDQAKNYFADMVVMGTKGISNVPNVLMGSTSVEVVNTVKCPIICIPERAEIAPPMHIMLATDYNNTANLDKLLVVKELAETNNSRIDVVNVKAGLKTQVQDNEKMENLVLDNFFGDIEQEFFDLEEDDVELAILNFAHQKGVDLIVLINRSRSFWENLFHKSVTHKLEFLSDIPLLILKD